MGIIAYIVDRIENGYAVLETELGFITKETSLLPKPLHEGMMLIMRDGELVSAEDAEEERRELINKKLSGLFEEEQ